jgi:hypothetical protein
MEASQMGKIVNVLLCLGICMSCLFTLTPVLADVKPDSCTVETHYSQDSDTATKQESGSTVTQTMTIRRYSQMTATCGYKEWLQAQTSYGTNHVQWSTTNVGSVQWYLPTAHGTVTFNAITLTKSDSEGYTTSGGVDSNSYTIYLKEVGNPSPGDMNFYWKSNNLQSEYYDYSLDVVIKSCVSGCTQVTLTLVLPYI